MGRLLAEVAVTEHASVDTDAAGTTRNGEEFRPSALAGHHLIEMRLKHALLVTARLGTDGVQLAAVGGEADFAGDAARGEQVDDGEGP
jgi:hypothetical protein